MDQKSLKQLKGFYRRWSRFTPQEALPKSGPPSTKAFLLFFQKILLIQGRPLIFNPSGRGLSLKLDLAAIKKGYVNASLRIGQKLEDAYCLG